MKIFTILLSLILVQAAFSQVSYREQMLQNTVYSNAPEQIKHSKAFIREWRFFEQRAYPNNFIPADAYEKSLEQRDELRIKNNYSDGDVTWVSLGPTPGEYFDYGKISSRIVSGTYDPQNHDIIYIGPAYGGVWKSTDGGVNWVPLTDNQPSMAMGAIVLDPDNPQIVYAGTGEATYSGASYAGLGLLKSTDGGTTWTPITAGLPVHTYFSRLVIRPGHNNELLAALGYNGLYKSTDSGETWSALLAGRCDEVRYTPTGDTVFVLGAGTAFKRSIDGGNTFSNFSSGLPLGERNHFDYCYSDPAYMYAAIYSSTAFRVFKSTDYGLTFSQVSPSTNFNWGQAWYDMYCRVNPVNHDVAFIGTIDVFRTRDGGATFENITNAYSGGVVHPDQHYLFFDPQDPNTFFACNDGGIYKSTDNGNSFINMNQNLTLTQFYRITTSPFLSSRILGGTQDNGTQQTYASLAWAAAFGGDGGEVAFNPFDQNYIIGETQNGGLTRTVNNGVSWMYNAMNGIDQNENVAWVAPILHHPSISGIYYVARQNVYKSTNNGGSWSVISSGYINGTNPVSELAISKSNPNVMLASSGNKVFRSSDGGINWTNVTTGLPNKTVSSIYIHPDNEEEFLVAFFGLGGDKVYKSDNSGNSWRSISGDLPDTPVNDLFIYTDDNVHPNTYFVATDIGAFLTKDDGVNWVELANGIPNTLVMHLDYSPETHTLRAGTHGRGVYEAYIDFYLPVELASFSASISNNDVNLSWETASETNNRGFEVERKFKNQDWQTIGYIAGNGTTSEIHSYQFKDETVTANYSGRILYRLKQLDFNGDYKYSNQVYTDFDFVPDQVTLSQNFPNPFNPSTTIKYSIPVESNVKLIIYNSLGQKVSELVNSAQASGNYQVTWNAADLSSGVYFYNLEVTDLQNHNLFKDSRKIVLVK
jgi:photosystem II stability/assembly factor-like uncharacterized protein